MKVIARFFALLFLFPLLLNSPVSAQAQTVSGAPIADQPVAIEDPVLPAPGADESAYSQGYALFYGSATVPADKTKAAQLFQKGADAGDARAELGFGYSYLKGEGNAEDISRALMWLSRASKKGSPQAYYFLAQQYERGHDEAGHGVFQDLPKALKYYETASDSGIMESTMKLAEIYHFGQVGQARDLKQAIHYYTIVAEKGEGNLKSEATAIVAHLYTEIGREETNLDEAVKWYMRSAELGDVNAEIYVAKAYQSGQGIPPNDAEAMKWFKKAASQDNPDAMVNLAYMYANGIATDIDYNQAFQLYTRAAELGNSEAAWNLGNFYQNGYSVPKDATKAAQWFRRAQSLATRKTS